MYTNSDSGIEHNIDSSLHSDARLFYAPTLLTFTQFTFEMLSCPIRERIFGLRDKPFADKHILHTTQAQKNLVDNSLTIMHTTAFNSHKEYIVEHLSSCTTLFSHSF